MLAVIGNAVLEYVKFKNLIEYLMCCYHGVSQIMTTVTAWPGNFDPVVYLQDRGHT